MDSSVELGQSEAFSDYDFISDVKKNFDRNKANEPKNYIKIDLKVDYKSNKNLSLDTYFGEGQKISKAVSAKVAFLYIQMEYCEKSSLGRW